MKKIIKGFLARLLVCVCLYLRLCLCLCVHVCTYVCLCLCTYFSLCMRMYVCKYMCTHVHWCCSLPVPTCVISYAATGRLELSHRKFNTGRMAYIIADMCYVLRNRPSTWSPGLRTSFVESFQVFLRILSLIQVRRSMEFCWAGSFRWSSGGTAYFSSPLTRKGIICTCIAVNDENLAWLKVWQIYQT